jgi:hypothetical protein
VLPLTVESVIVSVPMLKTPPPSDAVLPLRVVLVRVTVASLLFRMPPPEMPLLLSTAESVSATVP